MAGLSVTSGSSSWRSRCLWIFSEMASSRCRSFWSFVWFASAATCPSRSSRSSSVSITGWVVGVARMTSRICFGQAVHRIEEEHSFRLRQREPDLFARLHLLLPGHGLPSCE